MGSRYSTALFQFKHTKMKNFIRVIIQYYALNLLIVLDLALVAIAVHEKAYFLAFFILLCVVWMIHRLNTFYSPMYYLSKRGIALRKKVNEIERQGTIISSVEKEALLKELNSLRNDFKLLINKNIS